MTTTQEKNKSFSGGYSELVMVGILLCIAAILIQGSLTMNVLDDAKPGPASTPMIIGVGLIIISVFLTIDVIRNPETDRDTESVLPYSMSADMLHDLAGLSAMEDTILNHRNAKPATDGSHASGQGTERKLKVDTDWPTLLGMLVSTIGFVIVLPYLGWVLSAAALFWLASYLLGSKRPVFDLWVSLIVASTVQFVFAGLLGLNLPSGFLGAF